MSSNCGFSQAMADQGPRYSGQVKKKTGARVVRGKQGVYRPNKRTKKKLKWL
jgi:hypothetical protein